ncbi:MAG: hypothetical protein MUC83_19215, partial [Pirellula sp.]|nr:hypothetical protein [Pirellula sp.]
MLHRTSYGERSSDSRLVFGCDFGVPRRWEDQRKKIILLEAERVDERHYRVTSSGRNQRLAEWTPGSSKGPGWSLSELIESLQDTRDIRVGGLDFPFSIPESLLMSNDFSGAV